MGITALKIQEAAAKLGTPQAQAKADAAVAALKTQQGQLIDANAVRTSVLKQIQANGGSGLDPLSLGKSGLIPMKEAERTDFDRRSENGHQRHSATLRRTTQRTDGF